jgi:hypothetical protein
MNRAAYSNDHVLTVEVTSKEWYTDVLDSEERSTSADTFGYVFCYCCGIVHSQLHT